MSLDWVHTKRITTLALFSAVIYASQVVLSGLPNVNVVTMFFVLYIYIVGYKDTTIILFVFTFLMGITYGFGYWLLGYIWIYSILLVGTSIVKRYLGVNIYVLSIWGLLFGLLFGFLFAVHNHIIVGIDLIPYYISGIWFDVVHASSNLLAILFLLNPLLRVVQQDKYEY